MRVLLAVCAVLVALVAAGTSGELLTATGESPTARASQARATDHDPPRGNPAAREFVAAKKTWTACVAEAAPAHDGPGRFDPEAACGTKPRPHDDEFGKHGGGHPGQHQAKHQGKHQGRHQGKHQGPPAWSGGPDRRTTQPPGHTGRG
ncbi:MAG TPA: hypothetical protein VFN19_09350 [Candidatus Nanopelagicales bacterium]|nr:hypothetical protein [Candidatus Nanopelagicales bacterium]